MREGQVGRFGTKKLFSQKDCSSMQHQARSFSGNSPQENSPVDTGSRHPGTHAWLLYVHACAHAPKRAPNSLNLQTHRLAVGCHRLHIKGEKNKTKQKNTPMTLKSFYSLNHRLPSPWIRAVTSAPACLLPRLPKLPAGRQTGRVPSYCQGRPWRGRAGWERFEATHSLRASAGRGDSEK